VRGRGEKREREGESGQVLHCFVGRVKSLKALIACNQID